MRRARTRRNGSHPESLNPLYHPTARPFASILSLEHEQRPIESLSAHRSTEAGTRLGDAGYGSAIAEVCAAGTRARIW